MKPRRKARAPEDRVDGALHAEVLNRDRMCFGLLIRLHPAAATVDVPVPQWHQCRDTFGNEHTATDLIRMTVDHFWLDSERAGGTGAYGDRAPSDRYHLVAACGWLNGSHMTKDLRRLERAYIAWLYPRGPV